MSKHDDWQVCPACLETDYESYRHARVHESIDANDRWRRQFRIGEWSGWDYELESSTLTFSENGLPRVVANIEVVGSVHGDEWEWAWGNKTLPDSCRKRIGAVREFGEQKEWTRLTRLFLRNDEYLGWELTSIAAHILNATGAYRCPDEGKPGDFLYVVTFETRFVN